MTLLLAPEEFALYGSGYIQARPLPLALGVLQGALRAAGHDVSAYDLSPALERESSPEEWLALYDVDGVLESLGRGGDGALRERIDALLERRTSPLRRGGRVLRREQLHLEMHAGYGSPRGSSRATISRRLGGANADHLMQFRWMYRPLSGALKMRRAVSGEYASLKRFLEGVPLERLPGAVRLTGGEAVRNPVSRPSFVRPDFDGLPLEPYEVTLRRMADSEEEAREAERQLFGVSMARSQAISAQNHALPKLFRRGAVVLPYYFNTLRVHMRVCGRAGDWTRCAR